MNFDVEASQFEKPVCKFDLAVDRIDVDRYLPASAGSEDKEKHGGGTKGEGKPRFAFPRKAVVEGEIRIGELKIRGADLSQVMARVEMREGIIRVDPFSMSLYGGKLSGIFTGNLQQERPRIRIVSGMEHVDAGPLLKDLGYTDRIQGLIDFSGDISFRGTEPEQIRETLNGKGQFSFTDGAIVGFDIVQMVRNVKAVFGMEKTERLKTEFSELRGKFTLKDGLLVNPSTYLASPLLRVVGRGRIDLPRETIEYRVEPKFVATLQGQGDSGLRKGFMVPVEISGTISHPRFRPDLSGLLESEKVMEAAPKILEDLVGKEGGGEATKQKALKILEDLTQGKQSTEGGLQELIPGLFSSGKKE